MDKLKNISVLIKPSSSLCNLRCKYCFYRDVSKNRQVYNYGFISEETSINLIDKLFSSVSEKGNLTFNFQGGEPTLIGLDYYKFFVENVYKNLERKDINVNFSLQTNGTLLDENWAKFFCDNDFLIGISIDGFEEINNYYRVDEDNIGQFNKIIDAIGLLEKYSVKYNILSVLTNRLSHYPVELYNFYKKHNFKYIQLIPCLSPLYMGNKKKALKVKNFALFYKKLFDLWYEDENRPSIRLFEDVFPMMKGFFSITCGMLGYCTIQLVIEGDGGVYPCDFYVIDKYRLGNINRDNILDMIKSDISRKFLNEDKRYCKLCKKCKYFNICNGNCKRLSITMFDKDYCAYKDFLDYSMERAYKLLIKQLGY